MNTTVNEVAISEAARLRPVEKLARACGWLSKPLPIILLVAVWALVSDTGWYPSELLVPPQQVWAALLEMLDGGELQQHLQMSLHRLALGMLIGTGSGLAFGVLMALSKTVEVYTAPSFNVVRQVPSIALIPILILIFGIGETFKVLIVVKAAFFPVALATFTAVQGIPKPYFEVGRVYQLSTPVLLRRVVLPATVLPVFTGIRLALGRSWGTLVAAELLAAEAGIGQMMEFGRQMFRIDVVMVGVVVTGVIGFLFDRGMKLLERRLARWQTR